MGINARLETEDGQLVAEVADPTNILHRFLPNEADLSFVHVNAIDWYGNATFNYLQMPRFLEEWSRLEARCESESERELFSAIRLLADRAGAERHIYLVFRGD